MATIYPAIKFNAADYEIDKYIEVTAELAYNPAKVAIVAYGSILNAALLWQFNNILNPFKELAVGKILAVPSVQFASSVQIKGKSAGAKTRNVKVTGKKITY